MGSLILEYANGIRAIQLTLLFVVVEVLIAFVIYFGYRIKSKTGIRVNKDSALVEFLITLLVCSLIYIIVSPVIYNLVEKRDILFYVISFYVVNIGVIVIKLFRKEK